MQAIQKSILKNQSISKALTKSKRFKSTDEHMFQAMASLKDTATDMINFCVNHPSTTLSAVGAVSATAVYHQYLTAAHYRNEAMSFRRDAQKLLAQTQQNGIPPIHWAALNNDLTRLDSLSHLRPDVIHQEFHGKTPLHLAASYGHNQFVKELLNRGASPAVFDQNNESPLVRATVHGHKKTVKILLEHDPRNRSDLPNITGTSPLLIAVFSGRAKISQQLINANYSVEPNNDGVDPVTAAFYRWRESEYGFKDTYDALQKKHPDLTPKFSQLCEAVHLKHHQKVSTLLSHNHSPLSSSNGISPLSIAAKEGDLKLIQTMAPFVNQAHLQNASNNKLSLLHLVAANHENSELISYLIHQLLIPVNTQSRSKTTPLASAARMNYSNNVIHLLAEGADPNIPDMYGQVPLHWAARHNNTTMAIALLKKGALTNIRHSEFSTPVQTAITHQSFKMMDMFDDWKSFKQSSIQLNQRFKE